MTVAAVFEEATWKKGNRRAFAAVERLASEAGVEAYEAFRAPIEPAQQAFVLVYDIGFHLLQVCMAFYCAVDDGLDKKALRQLNNSVTADGGTRAGVLLSLAVASTTDFDPILLRQHYRVPGEDERFLDDALGFAPELSVAAAVITTRAIELACTFSVARTAPPFQRLGETDWRELMSEEARTDPAWGLVCRKIAHPWEDAQDKLLEGGSDHPV